MKGFHDVEHYRPKASADRSPGCLLRHGYWWLAFTWDNLLYSCPACNRSEKNNRFPTGSRSISLQAESLAPGGEIPLLLDPGSTTINPVEHIVFSFETVGPIGSPKQWWARSRNGSQLGHMTIDVCGLNRDELLELRSDYFETTIKPKIQTLNVALATKNRNEVQRELSSALGLLNAKVPYVAFAYDALRSAIPDAELQIVLQIGWPTPRQVGGNE